MRNFILGILTAIGGFALCGKMYEKGYDDCIKENENKKLSAVDISKRIKTK